MLRFTPPGFTYPVDIPFPGRVLPVCARCKKNYKTREHCRSKEGHTGLPWTDTYICITLDGTCFNPDGSLLNGPFHAQGVQSNPYVYPENITLDPKTPSCAQCKDKNYTRTYCRMSKKHKTLPWSTVYVTLTLARNMDGGFPPPVSAPAAPAVEAAEPSSKKMKKNNGEAAPSIDNDDAATVSPKKDEEDAKDGDLKRKKTSSDAADVTKKDEDAEIEKEKLVDIFKSPHPSRTFLSTVSVTKNEVKWVDLDQGAVALMQHRAPKPDGPGPEGAEMQPHGMYPPHSPYQMMPNGMHPGMGMNMHPAMSYPGLHPGMPGPVLGQGPMGSAGAGPGGNGGKDDPSRPPNGMDNSQHNQWGMSGPGGMPASQYPTPELMYNAAQMMDPRMGGYGFGWPGRGGYPMDMQGMQGGPGGQMPQMPSPYESHMMQQMNPGPGWPGMQQQGGGMMPPPQGNGDLPQSLAPNSSPGHGMAQQMHGMPRQMHMHAGGMQDGNSHDLKGDGANGMNMPHVGNASDVKDGSKDINPSETLQI